MADVPLFRVGLHVEDPPQSLWIGLSETGPCELDGLIGTDGFLDRLQTKALAPQIALYTDHEESLLTMDSVEPPKVSVATIERHDGLFLQGCSVQELDIAHVARC